MVQGGHSEVTAAEDEFDADDAKIVNCWAVQNDC
jgi:hypothetical protein